MYIILNYEFFFFVGLVNTGSESIFNHMHECVCYKMTSIVITTCI